MDAAVDAAGNILYECCAVKGTGYAVGILLFPGRRKGDNGTTTHRCPL